MTADFDRTLSRRRLVQAAGAGVAAASLGSIGLPASVLAAQDAGQIKEVARNRTLIHGITGNQMTDYNMFNPFLPGIGTSNGYPIANEGLFYYNAYNSETVCAPEGLECDAGLIPWIGESFTYNADFTAVTIKLRSGVEWSDGTPFTAKDVVFTVNMLKAGAPDLAYSIDMETWVTDIVATDDLTVDITLSSAHPRFMTQFFIYHFDKGIIIVPEHIWSAQDPKTFTNLDTAAGLPVTTGPWKLVLSTPQQRIFDRRDDWWAAKSGFHALPAPERFIVLPGTDETKMVQMVINNEVDLTIDLRPNNITAVTSQNPNVSTWSGTEPPYGYLDWWPIGLGFNCMAPPYDDPEIRWAINHTIDREQLVQFGYQGAGEGTTMVFPRFPAIEAFTSTIQAQFDSINALDLAKTEEIMTRKGYAKNGDGFWEKEGTVFSIGIYSLILFQDITPLIVEQLRKGGFDATFEIIVGPEFADSVYAGTVDAFILGHGGSVRDPYPTLNLYHSRYSLPTGERAQQPYRWVSPEFDALVDEMSITGEDDPNLVELFKQAMTLWIAALPDVPIVQWFHRIPTNTTYWDGFPSQENPYINTAYWHRTAPLWVNTITAKQ
jgi:peptide/nickel transport system substrate-binding protein